MKRIVLVIFCLILLAILCGCTVTTGNRAIGGRDIQTFHYGYVYLDGTEIVKGYITQWRDYDESDVVQVMIDGKYYLTHYSNVVLIADPAMGGMGYDNGMAELN